MKFLAAFCLLIGQSLAIFSGSEAAVGAHPFIVQFATGTIDDFEDTDNWICSGSLLSSKYVLTSATCVSEVLDNTFFNGGAATMFVNTQANDPTEDGETQRPYDHANPRSFPHYTFRWPNVFIHEQSDIQDEGWEDSDRNNLAIVEIGAIISDAGTFNFAEDFAFARIPAERAPECMQYTVAGWGSTAFGGDAPDGHTYPDRLYEAVIPSWNQSDCNDIYYEYRNNTNVCVGCPLGGSQHVGPCNGDWGGPLFHTDSANNVLQYGVMSKIPCTSDMDFEPFLYTSTVDFKEWICEKAPELDCELYERQPFTFDCMNCTSSTTANSCHGTAVPEIESCMAELANNYVDENPDAALNYVLMVVLAALVLVLLGIIITDS